MIPVYENYKDYQPPRYAYSAIVNLLSKLPKQYLSGLQSVVLTNAMAIGRGKTCRVNGKKYIRHECLGFYHPKKKGEAPWIEIVVDNVIAAFFASHMPHILWRLPVVRNMRFADTLFHEIGHHLDYTLGAPARSGEAAAEEWKKRLLRSYARKHYWYLVPLMRYALAPVLKLLMAILKGAARRREAALPGRAA
jgi:hypothetical protein